VTDVALNTGGDDQYVPLFAAGDETTGEYQCADCGYGVSIHGELPRCPMCGGESWEELTPAPPARALELL